jgi:signal transduction histidine kinase
VKPVTSSNFDQVQWLVLEKRLQRFSLPRALLAPIFWALMLLTLWGDTSIWRRWVIGTIAGFTVLAGVAHLLFPEWHTRHNSRSPWESRNVFRRTFFAAAFLGIFILATGGFDGPLLPIAIPLVFFVGSIGTTRALVPMAVAFLLLVGVLAVISRYHWISDALPAVFGGGAGVPQAPALLYAKAVVMLFLIVWAATIAHLVRTTFRETLEQGLKARDEFLEGQEAHARELTALTGELAHELKNPLASIKGLAILLGRDVKAGRAAERLSVLQGEVDRMETTLQSILTFSRPLLPLTESEVDLSELCASVISMHEGMAHVGQVGLTLVSPNPVVVRCDSRKLKQVLTNLLQNAIEVSPPDSNVEVTVQRARNAAARIEIRDHGPGISPQLKGRLFEPGVTDKEQGSGLGLALARGLVQQHGGQLLLDDNPNGGCTAVVVLVDRCDQGAVQ